MEFCTRERERESPLERPILSLSNNKMKKIYSFEKIFVKEINQQEKMGKKILQLLPKSKYIPLNGIQVIPKLIEERV